MSSQTAAILEELHAKRTLFQQSIMELISDSIYREKRYETHFSVAIVYSQEPLKTQAQQLRKTLRKTDKAVCITDNILCVVFDATQENSYVKAAENLYRTLKSIEYHQDYFIATVFSNEFDTNYLNMFNHLFERLFYSIQHNCKTNVNYEDYII